MIRTRSCTALAVALALAACAVPLPPPSQPAPPAPPPALPAPPPAPLPPPAETTPIPAPAPAAPTAPADSPETVSWLACGERIARVGTRGDSQWLSAAGQTVELQPVVAASGARFEAVGDPTTSVWNKGTRAALVLRGLPYPECRVLSATPPAYRAFGNEPFWTIEVDAERLTLRRPGQPEVIAPWPAAVLLGGARNYTTQAGGRPLTVTVADQVCTDTMSDISRPHTVTLSLDGQTLRGCGGTPFMSLAGGEWQVESIDGEAVVERSRLTLSFEAAPGRVAGSAGCNRFTAGYQVEGERLTITQAAATRRMCPNPAVMQQEARFLERLGQVTQHEFDATGALILHAGEADGRTRSIKARKPI